MACVHQAGKSRAVYPSLVGRLLIASAVLSFLVEVRSVGAASFRGHSSTKHGSLQGQRASLDPRDSRDQNSQPRRHNHPHHFFHPDHPRQPPAHDNRAHHDGDNHGGENANEHGDHAPAHGDYPAGSHADIAPIRSENSHGGHDATHGNHGHFKPHHGLLHRHSPGHGDSYDDADADNHVNNPASGHAASDSPSHPQPGSPNRAVPGSGNPDNWHGEPWKNSPHHDADPSHLNNAAIAIPDDALRSESSRGGGMNDGDANHHPHDWLDHHGRRGHHPANENGHNNHHGRAYAGHYRGDAASGTGSSPESRDLSSHDHDDNNHEGGGDVVQEEDHQGEHDHQKGHGHGHHGHHLHHSFLWGTSPSSQPRPFTLQSAASSLLKVSPSTLLPNAPTTADKQGQASPSPSSPSSPSPLLSAPSSTQALQPPETSPSLPKAPAAQQAHEEQAATRETPGAETAQGEPPVVLQVAATQQSERASAGKVDVSQKMFPRPRAGQPNMDSSHDDPQRDLPADSSTFTRPFLLNPSVSQREDPARTLITTWGLSTASEEKGSRQRVAGSAPWATVSQQDLWTSGAGGYNTFRIPAIVSVGGGVVLAFCEGRRLSSADWGDIDVVMKRSTDGGVTWDDDEGDGDDHAEDGNGDLSQHRGSKDGGGGGGGFAAAGDSGAAGDDAGASTSRRNGPSSSRGDGAGRVICSNGHNTCDSATPVYDSITGHVLLLVNYQLANESEAFLATGKSAYGRKTMVYRSEDKGLTWLPPVDISASVAHPGWAFSVVGPGNGIQLKKGKHKGRIVIPCDNTTPPRPAPPSSHGLMGRLVDAAAFLLPSALARHIRPRPSDAYDGPTYGSHVIYSDDHGASWRVGGIVGGSLELPTNEATVAELEDGTLMLNTRLASFVSPTVPHVRAVTRSHDGGATWRRVAFEAALPDPSCQGSLVSVPRDGALLFSNPASASVRERMTVRASMDGGVTWPHQLVIHYGNAAYSSLTTALGHPHGRTMVLSLYETGTEDDGPDVPKGVGLYKRIRLARFELKDLLQGGPPLGAMQDLGRPVDIVLESV